MSWTLTTSGSAIAKAGANANAVIVADSTRLAKWSDNAEGFISTKTNRDWITYYSSLNQLTKDILEDVASSIIAKQIISYDMSGYADLAEAQTMLDVQDNLVSDGLKLLEQFDSTTFNQPI